MIIAHDDAGRILFIQGIYPPEYKNYLEREGIKYLDIDLDTDAYTVSQEAFVRNGQLMQRPAIPAIDRSAIASDGQDTIVISGLPKPCVVRVDDAEYLIDEGQLDFTVNAPGTYRIVIDHWPFLPWTAQVVAS